MIYVARQLGHGAALTMRTYGHVIDELEDRPRMSAEDAIAAALGGARVLGQSSDAAAEPLRGAPAARPDSALRLA